MRMRHYHIELQALAPVALGGPRGASRRPETEHYISGGVLRGSIAGAVLREGMSPEAADFQDLFLRGRVLYPNLYPAPYVGDARSFPAPASYRACKRFGVGHGWTNALGSIRTEGAPPSCDHDFDGVTCDNPLVGLNGFYHETDEGIADTKVSSQLFTRTAIDRARRAVHSGSLYTIAAIARGQRFSGDLSCHADIAGVIEDTLRAGTVLYVGGSRTRGLGEVEVTEMRPADDPTPIRKRAQKLRDTLGDDLFTVDLVSPVILRDRFWRPVQDIDPERLQAWAGPNAFSVEGAWKSMTEVRGWNAAWGLPKTPDMAIERGSVFSFRLPSLDGVDWDALDRIEDGRIGERRSEGFGAIRFCHEWHTLSAEGSHG